jgi:hypothetical protein
VLLVLLVLPLFIMVLRQLMFTCRASPKYRFLLMVIDSGCSPYDFLEKMLFLLWF